MFPEFLWYLPQQPSGNMLSTPLAGMSNIETIGQNSK
jgi:hypothetical protein